MALRLEPGGERGNETAQQIYLKSVVTGRRGIISFEFFGRQPQLDSGRFRNSHHSRKLIILFIINNLASQILFGPQGGEQKMLTEER